MLENRRVIVLDGEAVPDSESLHPYLRQQIELPEYYGNNLDALYDVLTDIMEDTVILLKNGDVFAERMGWYGRQLLRVLKDAAEDNCYLELVKDKLSD